MKHQNIQTLIIAVVVTGMILTMEAKMKDASIIELCITGAILMAGLLLAWWNNPYAYGALPLEKISGKDKTLYWITWALTYVPLFIYIQLPKLAFVAKAAMAVLFLLGSVKTKHMSKWINKKY